MYVGGRGLSRIIPLGPLQCLVPLEGQQVGRAGLGRTPRFGVPCFRPPVLRPSPG
jgi:hypothetical protein